MALLSIAASSGLGAAGEGTASGIVPHRARAVQCVMSRGRREVSVVDVLGAYTLEGFGLGVDPVQRTLIPALQYGAATA